MAVRKELLTPQTGCGCDASLSVFSDGPPGSSLSCLEEEEGDARPTSVSLAPAGHPELSHVPLRARPSTRGWVVAGAGHVFSVWPIWGVATSSRAEASEVQVVLWRGSGVRVREGGSLHWHETAFFYQWHYCSNSIIYIRLLILLFHVAVFDYQWLGFLIIRFVLILCKLLIIAKVFDLVR